MMFGIVSVSRPPFGVDLSGGISQTPATSAYVNVRATVQGATSKQQIYYQQRGLETTHTVYTETPLVLHSGDTINDGTYNYRVIGWADWTGAMGGYLEIATVRYTGSGL